MDYMAKREYERTRGLVAFNVNGYSRKYRNQHAIGYVFPDDSRLVIYGGFSEIGWGPNTNTIWGRRILK